MSMNEDIMDDFVEMQHRILRVSDTTARKYVIELLKLESYITDQVENTYDPEFFSTRGNVLNKRKRLNDLLREIRKEIDRVYEQIENGFEDDLVRIGNRNAQQAVNIVSNNLGTPVVMGEVRLTTTLVRSYVNNSMLIQGSLYRELMRNLESNQINRITNTIRSGFQAGITTDQMIRDLRGRRVGTTTVNGKRTGLYKGGIYDTGRHELTTAVRTGVNTVANDIRFMELQRHDDILKGVQWVSTWDTRTTKICISLDGESWDFDRNKLPGTIKVWRGPPPAHPNCRSMLSPLTKTWAEYKNDHSIKGEEIPIGQRESMDGLQPGNRDIRFLMEERWSDERALRLLGRTRFDLWKSGRITDLRRLTDVTGRRVLTVDEL